MSEYVDTGVKVGIDGRGCYHCESTGLTMYAVPGTMRLALAPHTGDEGRVCRGSMAPLS